jgi:hypothetical protein
VERGALGVQELRKGAVACDISITVFVCHGVEEERASLKSAARRSSRIEACLTLSVTKRKRESVGWSVGQ